MKYLSGLFVVLFIPALASAIETGKDLRTVREIKVPGNYLVEVDGEGDEGGGAAFNPLYFAGGEAYQAQTPANGAHVSSFEAASQLPIIALSNSSVVSEINPTSGLFYLNDFTVQVADLSAGEACALAIEKKVQGENDHLVASLLVPANQSLRVTEAGIPTYIELLSRHQEHEGAYTFYHLDLEFTVNSVIYGGYMECAFHAGTSLEAGFQRVMGQWMREI